MYFLLRAIAFCFASIAWTKRLEEFRVCALRPSTERASVSSPTQFVFDLVRPGLPLMFECIAHSGLQHYLSCKATHKPREPSPIASFGAVDHAPFGIALTDKAIDNQLPGSRIFVIVILDSDSTIFLTTLIRFTTQARFLPAGRNAVINGALIDKNARIGDGL